MGRAKVGVRGWGVGRSYMYERNCSTSGDSATGMGYSEAAFLLFGIYFFFVAQNVSSRCVKTLWGANTTTPPY